MARPDYTVAFPYAHGSVQGGDLPVIDKLRELLTTFFYVGYLPWMPGTWGSIAAAAVFVTTQRPAGAAGWIIFGGMLAVCAFALFHAERIFGARDPEPVVLDEVAGMWLTFILAGSPNWVAIAAGFVLFRALDIIKPFPIGRLERLPGGLGILADDLGAGLVAGIIVRAASILNVC
jgi:phosphatidylglycerophosphatase A